jgi:hypothetical protein
MDFCFTTLANRKFRGSLADGSKGVHFLMTTVDIGDLWHSKDAYAWQEALRRYWDYVRPTHVELERALECLDLRRIREFTPLEWYEFLRDEYFRWKYTAPNRYATTTRHLRRYLDEECLEQLDRVRQQLVELPLGDLRRALVAAREIHGLGTAGASGLLALMHPNVFATVDQFVVKALAQVRWLPEALALTKMHPESLSIDNAVVLIGIMQRQAAALNHRFCSDFWTPRKVDQVLWAYGR